ncbi:glycoside hydrolase family 108 protein [Methylocella sp.]|uniref:glycoside hydrolase family 108 protein n=1 Tax=Methylocella sp. TaxID=1978226 RepID=UPI0037836C0B
MAVGRFSACLPYTLKEEGGFSNDPRDPGGRTMRGITQKTYDELRRRAGAAPRDVRDIAEGEVSAIYRLGYWNAVGAESLPAGVDLSVFDFAVNSGPARAKKALAQAAGLSPAQAISRVAERRLGFLHGLSTWRAFGRGWGARVARIEAASLRMAGAPVAAAAKAAAARGRAAAAQAKGGALAASAGGLSAHHGFGGAGAGLAAAALLTLALLAAYRACRQRQRAAALEEATRAGAGAAAA